MNVYQTAQTGLADVKAAMIEIIEMRGARTCDALARETGVPTAIVSAILVGLVADRTLCEVPGEGGQPIEFDTTTGS